MKKIIKKYGNTNVVTFTKEDMITEKLQVGDTIEIKKEETNNGTGTRA